MLLVGLVASAQTFDKALLVGKWHAIGIAMSGMSVNKDDMATSKKTIIEMVQQQTPGYEYSDADSAIVNTAMKTMFDELAKCVISFDKNGDMKMIIAMNGQNENLQGTYKWVGDKQLFLDDTSAKNDDDTVTVVQLSKTRFAFTSEEENGTITMIFEKH